MKQQSIKWCWSSSSTSMTPASFLTGDSFRTTRFERRVVDAVLTSLSDETLIDSSSRFDTLIDDFRLRLFRPRLWPSLGSSEASLSTTGATLVDVVAATTCVDVAVVAFVLCRVVLRTGGVSASSSSSSASTFDLFGIGGHVAFFGLDEARPIL